MITDPKIFNNPNLEVYDCPHREGVLRYRRRNSAVTPKTATDLNDQVTELITELQTKRPDWLFAAGYGISRELHIYTKDKEHLGRVEYVVAYYGAERDYFQLDNFRVQANSTRATAGRCYSTKKAVERILANYRPRNIEEVTKARAEVASNKISNIVATARSKWTLSRSSTARQELLATALNKPEAFADTPLAPILTKELIQEWRDYSAAMVLQNPANFEIITEIERDGGRQLYCISGMPQAYWLDPEKHREVISKVAMLRMVDVGDVVPGIGFRSDDNTFVVLGDTT